MIAQNGQSRKDMPLFSTIHSYLETTSALRFYIWNCAISQI